METEAPDPQDFEMLSRELVLSSLVHEVTRVMLSAPDMDRALQSFLLGIMELTGAQNMLLLSIREGQAELVPGHSLGLGEEALSGLRLITLADDPVYACLASNRHILVEKRGPDDPFAGTGAQSYLVLPITAPAPIVGNQKHGRIQPLAVLWLDTSPPCPPLTGQAISHLTGLGRQAGLMMENFRVQGELAAANGELQNSHARLNLAYAALTRAQQRIEEDLDRARAIQNSLLPNAFPTHLLRRVASKYFPAGKVGGDYYDCFELEPGLLGIVIADVSGHGIAAALVMSMFKALLHNFAAMDRSPCAALNRINATFIGQFGGAHFVTAFYAVFNKAERRLTYCNAGHVPQYLLQAPVPEPGAIPSAPALTEMPSQGLVLGVFANTFLRDAALELSENARLLLYTDGITEAHGPKGKMFGPEPLKSLALRTGNEHPAAVIDELMRLRDEFLGPAVEAKPAAAPETRAGGSAEEVIIIGDEGNLGDDATLVILDL